MAPQVGPGQRFATFSDPDSHLNRVTGPHRDRVTNTPEYKRTMVRRRVLDRGKASQLVSSDESGNEPLCLGTHPVDRVGFRTLEVPESRHGVMPVAKALAAGGALCLFVAGARSARSGRVRAIERSAFAAMNGLTSSARVPVWTVMQLGSLGGALGVAAVAAGSGHRHLAGRLGVAGTTTWAAAKLVKRFVRRGRPGDLLEQVRILGRDPSGLGYPSGHAAVASALAVVVFPVLPHELRPLVPVIALAVGAARVYVGAHLPLDVAGGIAFGAAIGLGADVLSALTSP